MLYTATNLICTLGGNIALNGYVKKHYPYIRKYKNESITVQEKKLIKSKVFALIYHKIGGYLVNGGDYLVRFFGSCDCRILFELYIYH